MKKLVYKLCGAVAAISLISANIGAGLASAGGWYQPKVPSRISK